MARFASEANKAAKAIDPYLIAKYNLDITCKGNIVYDHKKPLLEFYPLVSAGSKGKGVNLYDCNFFPKQENVPKKDRKFIKLEGEFQSIRKFKLLWCPFGTRIIVKIGMFLYLNKLLINGSF